MTSLDDSADASSTGVSLKENVVTLPVVSSPQTILLSSLALAIILIIGFIYAVRRRTSKKGSLVLLVGPSDAGKTALLTSLVYGQTLPTHASLQANSSVIVSEDTKRQVRIVDIPGHLRIRDQFKEYLLDAKAIAFVVDASTITRNGAHVAEHLHHILHAIVSLPPTHHLPALAILAHKSDLLSAPTSLSDSDSASLFEARTQLATARVRTILERELEKRRASQAGGVGVGAGGADEDEGAQLAGLDCRGGGEFRFAEWDGGEVQFLGTWVSFEQPQQTEKSKEADEDENGPLVQERGDDGLDAFREWIDELS